jgi:ribosomal protein S12 methylthiotransferase accessory factor
MSTDTAVVRQLQAGNLLELWEYLVDRRTGVVQDVSELAIDDDEPDFFHYLSTASDTGQFTALSNFRNNGGASISRQAAAAKAIGEAVERYCAAMFRYNHLVLSPYAALDRPGTAPDAFALYREEQYVSEGFSWRPFEDQSIVAWTPARSLRDGREVLVPAPAVFVPYHYRLSTGETPIMQPISTGLAAGLSFSQAASSGICEVVERDAFTIMWQARMARPRIDRETLPPSVQSALNRFTDVGLDVKLIDITTDIRIPTVMTIALGDAATSPAVAVAAATDPSPEVALIKSLEELAHTRKFARQVMEFLPPLPVDIAGGHPLVQDQKQHLRFYCGQEAKDYIAFAWSSQETTRLADMADKSAESPEDELAALVHEVHQAGHEVLACDLTTPDIASLGLAVVRVLAPGLHPLFMGYRNRALGGNRLYEVPQRLGHIGIETGGPDNPYPHPFP